MVMLDETSADIMIPALKKHEKGEDRFLNSKSIRSGELYVGPIIMIFLRIIPVSISIGLAGTLLVPVFTAAPKLFTVGVFQRAEKTLKTFLYSLSATMGRFPACIRSPARRDLSLRG